MGVGVSDVRHVHFLCMCADSGRWPVVRQRYVCTVIWLCVVACR